MALNFPSSPSIGQTYPSPATPGVPVWTWNGTAWVAGSIGQVGYVRYDAAQALTAAQMEQARKNIIAAGVEALGHGDIIINGNMEVSQQVAFDTAVSLVNGAYTYLADQWPFYRVSASAVFAGQVYTATSVDGFQHMIGAVATTAMGAPASSDVAGFVYAIEGFRWSRLSYGLSWAKPLTIGFWVFPTASGTMHVAIRNAAGNRAYVVPVVLTGNTWNYKTVTIPGDVTGTWPRDNTLGCTIMFCFAAGTSWHTASPNAWVAGANVFATSSQTNFFAATNSQVYMTGVYAIPGNEPITQERVPYSFRPYPVALEECQRYWQRIVWSVEYYAQGAQVRHSYTAPFKAPMRATPTRTRITTGSSTNVRASDPATYVTANALSESDIFFSFEPNAAGNASAGGFVEGYSARML